MANVSISEPTSCAVNLHPGQTLTLPLDLCWKLGKVNEHDVTQLMSDKEECWFHFQSPLIQVDSRGVRHFLTRHEQSLSFVDR